VTIIKRPSVRAVVAKARVNQASINYHFGGKDGLYREVLRTTIRALTEQQLAHVEEMKAMSRENALEFVKYQRRPLAAGDELSRHFRIFNWEAVRPTAIYRKLMSEEATRIRSTAKLRNGHLESPDSPPAPMIPNRKWGHTLVLMAG
jgi:AcrR family transcriptional regulator